MIRVNTFTEFNNWTKPFVSEVAEIVNLLKEYDYDTKKLAALTGLQEKNLCKWTENYKKEPYNTSTIPYPCWCFLSALVGKHNIQNNGKEISVDVRKVLSYFKPTAFVPNNKFVCPTTSQLSHLINNENYPLLTSVMISEKFNWSQSQFEESLEKGSLPFLNWCLIIMSVGLNVQKMILKDLPEDFALES